MRIHKNQEDERLGIRFVRDDEGFDREMWGRDDAVTPIVAALDPKGEAARAGMEIDDMVCAAPCRCPCPHVDKAVCIPPPAGAFDQRPDGPL